MQPRDPYVEWIERRAQAQVPAGFSSRVMTRLEQRREAVTRGVVVGWLMRLAATRAGRIALCSVALAAGLIPFVLMAYAVPLTVF